MKSPNSSYFPHFISFLSFTLKSIAQSSSDRRRNHASKCSLFWRMMERKSWKAWSALYLKRGWSAIEEKDFTITSFEFGLLLLQKGTRNPNLHKNRIISIRVQGNTAIAETELYGRDLLLWFFDFVKKLARHGKIVNKKLVWKKKALNC